METYNELKERFFAGDDDIELCILCGEIRYVDKMQKIEGEWYCGCNIENEDTVSLIKKEKERVKNKLNNMHNISNLHPLFQQILNTYKH